MLKTFYNGRRGPAGPVYRRPTPDYRSDPVDRSVGARKDTQSYSGSYVKGIATMHKSNAVPVTNSEFAKDVAKMRRG